MQTRFKIPQIVEFYGATEMPIGFMNLNNKFGAVGRASPLLVGLFGCKRNTMISQEGYECINNEIGMPYYCHYYLGTQLYAPLERC